MQPFAKNMAVEYAAKALPDGELAQALQAQQEAINKKYTQVDAASWDLDNLTEEQSNIIESMKVILAYNGHFFVPTYYNTDADHVYCGYTCLEVYDASTIYSKVIKYERYTPTAGSGTAELNEFTHSLGGTKLYKHEIKFKPDIQYASKQTFITIYTISDTPLTIGNLLSIDSLHAIYVKYQKYISAGPVTYYLAFKGTSYNSPEEYYIYNTSNRKFIINIHFNGGIYSMQIKYSSTSTPSIDITTGNPPSQTWTNANCTEYEDIVTEL